MTTFAAFIAGFAGGWIARSTVDSSRGAIVSALSGSYGLVDWIQRTVATEREFLSDLVAESKARVGRLRVRGRAPLEEVEEVEEARS